MNAGDRVQVKEHRGGGRWAWSNQYGEILEADKHCYRVRLDNGEEIRDVREHFRRPQS